jgi:lysophospholipase L1-like esterase
VANVPPLDRLPAYLACQPFAPTLDGCDSTRRLPPPVVDQAVADYNAAIAAVAQKDGATLVDLHAVVMAARAGGTEAQLVSADGFHPSTVGARVIAQAFTDALKRAWPNLAG